jgi:hypothetical protein
LIKDSPETARVRVGHHDLHKTHTHKVSLNRDGGTAAVCPHDAHLGLSPGRSALPPVPRPPPRFRTRPPRHRPHRPPRSPEIVSVSPRKRTRSVFFAAPANVPLAQFPCEREPLPGMCRDSSLIRLPLSRESAIAKVGPNWESRMASAPGRHRRRSADRPAEAPVPTSGRSHSICRQEQSV